jgi:hypothetical protein
MTPTDRTGMILVPKNTDARRARIQEIIARGNVVVFRAGNIVKKVDHFNEDEHGDLRAFEVTGISPYVCWRAEEYEITEEPKNPAK